MQHATPLAPYSMKVCRGAQQCPHAVLTQDINADLEKVINGSGWSKFLADRVTPIRHHHQFRIAVSSCPNGCSQPHIADFALIARAHVVVHPEKCSGCGQCMTACAENALRMDRTIMLDESLCLGCRACTTVCPEAALEISAWEYRVLVGGKLGRHPRLAHELGRYAFPEALKILGSVLTVLMEHHRPGLRLGDLVVSMGQEHFNRLILP